jgi:hypothetical protein
VSDQSLSTFVFFVISVAYFCVLGGSRSLSRNLWYAPLVGRWHLRAVDDEHFDWSFVVFELEAELFTESGEE